ncbi:hypothetical protein JOB18_027539 [Solea senegalensis]|uniref:Uncharacterized protein n=1 Tax=Solea senegalensis TaxID=28829 RepID=A0AAV6PDS0_SOLSE|nr:hypothetical protein JOB18_027539 [Solea senegalensis]
MGNKMSQDQIINLVKYCHMTRENTGVEIASADKTLLRDIFPISNGLGAINIWRECEYASVKKNDTHAVSLQDFVGRLLLAHADIRLSDEAIKLLAGVVDQRKMGMIIIGEFVNPQSQLAHCDTTLDSLFPLFDKASNGVTSFGDVEQVFSQTTVHQHIPFNPGLRVHSATLWLREREFTQFLLLEVQLELTQQAFLQQDTSPQWLHLHSGLQGHHGHHPATHAHALRGGMPCGGCWSAQLLKSTRTAYPQSLMEPVLSIRHPGKDLRTTVCPRLEVVDHEIFYSLKKKRRFNVVCLCKMCNTTRSFSLKILISLTCLSHLLSLLPFLSTCQGAKLSAFLCFLPSRFFSFFLLLWSSLRNHSDLSPPYGPRATCVAL